MHRIFIAVLLLLLVLPVLAQDEDTPPWSSSIGAGVAVTSGNSDTRNLNFSFNTLYDPKTERLFKADVIYLLGETDGERQVEKASANARFERLFDDRAFWFGEVQYLRDPLKEISHLISPLAGAGYHLIRTNGRKLTVDGAVGAIFEDGAASDDSTSAAVKAGESFEWQISDSSRFTQRLSGLWKADDFSDALYHFDSGLITTVAERLELKLAYVYDYRNRVPSPEVEKGDSALFAALVFKF
jgi:putative salt-induced outer membrane protein